MIALVVMTDGRAGCLDRAVASAAEHLHGPITRRVIHDDSGDLLYRDWLTSRHPQWEVIGDGDRLGFGGAYRRAWKYLTDAVSEPFVFGTEDDFTFNRDVDLSDLVTVLDSRPYLMQLALRRQPWNADELAAGGIVEQHPADYLDCCEFVPGHDRPFQWLEHRRFWTTNPSLYRRAVCSRGWPDTQHSEGIFTHRLLEDPAILFGFWGDRYSGEWVHHIGVERVGVGY